METFQELSNASVEVIARPVVERILGPIGFEHAACLKWVRSADAPIRQIFTFHKWKGGVIAPSWGVSLDFVPHIAAGKVRWHRTVKSAMQDLRLDARDPRFEMSYTGGPDPIRNRIEKVMRLAFAEAQAFWAVAKTVGDLPAACEWVRRYYARQGEGYDIYTQHVVSPAFILARNGRTDEARVALERLVDRYGSMMSEAAIERLTKLLAEAAES